MRRVLPLFTLLSGFALGLSLLSVPGCGSGEVIPPEGCQKDTDCREPRVCDYDTGRCVSPDGTCEVDDDCPGQGWRCAPVSGTCVDPECIANSECGDGRYCDLESFTCYDPECEVAADCGDGTGYNCENLKCVERECETDATCHPGVCETEQGKCYDCLESTDCSLGESCVDNVCQVQASCLDTATECDPNRYSDPDAGSYAIDSYGTLLLLLPDDTKGPGLEGELLLQNKVVEGVQGKYWPLGSWYRDPSTARLLPRSLFGNSQDVRLDTLYQIVDAAGQPLGDPILLPAPHSGEYSPVHQVVEVEAPAGYAPNTIRSYSTLQKALNDPGTGLVLVEATVPVLRVIQVVAEGVNLAGTLGAAGEPQKLAFWHAGKRIWGIELPASAASSDLPVLSADPVSPLKQEGWLFVSDRAVCPPLVERPFGDALYSPLVRLNVVEVLDCAPASVAETAQAARAGVADGTYPLIERIWTLMAQQP